MTPDEPSPQDAPEFDRALGVNDSVPDSEYGDQRYHPERGAVDSGQIPVGDLHEALLAGMSEDTLRRRGERVGSRNPRCLSDLTDTITQCVDLLQSRSRHSFSFQFCLLVQAWRLPPQQRNSGTLQREFRMGRSLTAISRISTRSNQRSSSSG